jgi:DNA-binding transcriptional LysR family regulator
VTSIAEEPLVLVLPAQHPAALRSQVPLACLNGANFVLPPSTKLFGLRGQIDELLKHNHCTPAIVQEAAWITTVLSLVAGGVGLTTPRAKATGIPRRDYSTSELRSTHQEDPKFSDA